MYNTKQFYSYLNSSLLQGALVFKKISPSTGDGDSGVCMNMRHLSMLSPFVTITIDPILTLFVVFCCLCNSLAGLWAILFIQVELDTMGLRLVSLQVNSMIEHFSFLLWIIQKAKLGYALLPYQTFL